jgi:acetylornithine/succinyldiaminopimelate/putrescine aminotransferase
MPDIVTMAKGIAGGFPMGALVTTPGETAPQQLPSLRKMEMKQTLCW